MAKKALTDKQEIIGKGQPRIFKDDQAFYDMAKSYIIMCKDETQLANIAGFCVYCDMTRESYYKQKEYYSDTFKKVENMLESAALNHPATAMGIFYLKNKFGFRDKIETENINLNHDMTEDEADAILNRFK